MSSSSSPLLVNSAFASLNLFPTAPSHRPTQQYFPSSPYFRPESKTKKSVFTTPPLVPTRYSSFEYTDLPHHAPSQSSPSQQQLHTPRATSPLPMSPAVVLLDSPITPSSTSFHPYSSIRQSASVMDLGSPCVITGARAAESQRGSVHVDKHRLISWARPFKGESNPSPVQLFGHSAQRSRRVKKHASASSMDLSYPSPASSSSDEENLPLTPAAPESEVCNPTWMVSSDCTGLGVKGLKEFDMFSIETSESRIGMKQSASFNDAQTPSPLPMVYELASPIGSTSALTSSDLADRRQGATPARLLTSSLSLGALGSPSNITELRQLQQAAVDLEHEARQPFNLNLPRERERRIRRKAVPVVLEEDISECSQQSAVVKHSFTLEVVASSDLSRSSSGISSPSSDMAESSSAASSTFHTARPIHVVHPSLSSQPSTVRETPMRRFYSNAKATMSMIDISPRMGSMPMFTSSSNATPVKAHSRSTSQPDSPLSRYTPASQRKNSNDGASDSGESWDMPLTPRSFGSENSARVGGNGFLSSSPPKSKKDSGIYGNKSAFLSQLDLGLKRVLDKKPKDQEGKSSHKRGLSRFLGLKA